MVWIQAIKGKLKRTLKGKKRGVLSIPFVIGCLAALVIFVTALNEYNNYLIIRNIEATSDLAAVEALRAYVDETELRDEKLVIKPENFPKIRELFLEKIRDNLPSHSFKIIRIEIPTTVRDGNNVKIKIPANYANVDDTNAFPNSSKESFTGPYSTMSGERTEYLLGGTSTSEAAMSIVKDTTNLATSGTKTKTRASYILTAKVTVLYKVDGFYNTVRSSLLNYFDILSGDVTRVTTIQTADKNVMAVTVQAIGKVTLR